MKTKFAVIAAVFLFGGMMYGEQPDAAMGMPSKLGAPANLKHFDVTIRRFDPTKGLASGEEFVLPVDRIDVEHAISSTMSNAVAFTKKSQGSEVLTVAFCCTGIKERK